jgi:sRNA-binding regulator protein Hfq
MNHTTGGTQTPQEAFSLRTTRWGSPQTEQLYLDDLVATGKAVNLYLNSGVKLVGVIAAHSGDVLWLQPQSGREDELAMIYIHNISTISPVSSRSFSQAHELNGVPLDGRRHRG